MWPISYQKSYFYCLIEYFVTSSWTIQYKRLTLLWKKIISGKRTGLAARMKQTWPHLVVTHCLAHRLELTFRDTLKTSSSSHYDKLMTLLLGLYYLYKKSSKQKKSLKRSFKALKMNQILPSRVGGTRWLPHVERAISAFVKGYKPIKMQLETASHQNSKAEGLAVLMRNGGIISYMLILKVQMCVKI